MRAEEGRDKKIPKIRGGKNILKRGKAYLIFTIVVLVFTSILTVDFKPLYAQTQDEKNLFNTLKGRYQDGQAPQKVKDIIDSFDSEQKIEICDKKATIKYSAKLVTWSSPPARADCEGWTTFKASYEQKVPHKIVKVEIEVMFNLVTMKPREDSKDRFQQIINDGWFYHEMLHAWLAVHGKIRDTDWCKEFCECKKDFEWETEDDHHKEIYPWQFTYMKELATAANYTVVEKEVDTQAEGDGSFSIPTSIDKRTYEGDKEIYWKNHYFHPEWLKNVDLDPNPLDWDSKKNHIVIKGKLKDKTKPGQVKIIIDPQSIFAIITSDIYPLGPVGGIAFPADKLTLLAPWITLAALIAIAAASVALYRRRHKA